MSCHGNVCKKDECCEVKAAMLDLGFTNEEVADVVEKHGTDILSTVIDGLRLGLSKEFVLEVLTKWGPYLLDLLLSIFKKKEAAGMVGVDLSSIVDGVLIDNLLKRLLPALVDKYGEQLVNLLAEALLNYIRNLTK